MILQLNSNLLSGSVPDELGSLTGLTELLLSENQLTGSFPLFEDEVMSHLQFLYLSHNPELTGTVSLEQLYNWTTTQQLQFFDVNASAIKITGLDDGTNGILPEVLKSVFNCSFWKYYHENSPCLPFQ